MPGAGWSSTLASNISSSPGTQAACLLVQTVWVPTVVLGQTDFQGQGAPALPGHPFQAQQRCAKQAEWGQLRSRDARTTLFSDPEVPTQPCGLVPSRALTC